jgi:hypothetical protein
MGLHFLLLLHLVRKKTPSPMYLPKGRKVFEIRANTCVRWISPKHYPLLPYCSTPPPPPPASPRASLSATYCRQPTRPRGPPRHQDGWRASPTLPPSPAAGVEAEEEREKNNSQQNAEGSDVLKKNKTIAGAKLHSTQMNNIRRFQHHSLV